MPYILGKIYSFLGGAVVKKLPGNTGDAGDLGSIPGSGRSPGGGNGTPLQYSCWENPMNRGVWWATVYGLQSWTWMSMHLHTYEEEGCVYLVHTKTSSELPGELPSFWEFLEIYTRWKEQRSSSSLVWTSYSFRMCFVLPPSAPLLMIFSLLGMPLLHLFPHSSPWLSNQRHLQVYLKHHLYETFMSSCGRHTLRWLPSESSLHIFPSYLQTELVIYF